MMERRGSVVYIHSMAVANRLHSKNLMLRLSPGERALVEALAAYKGVGMADAIRIALRSYAEQTIGRHRFHVPEDLEKRAGLLAALLKQRASKRKPQ